MEIKVKAYDTKKLKSKIILGIGRSVNESKYSADISKIILIDETENEDTKLITLERLGGKFSNGLLLSKENVNKLLSEYGVKSSKDLVGKIALNVYQNEYPQNRTLGMIPIY